MRFLVGFFICQTILSLLVMLVLPMVNAPINAEEKYLSSIVGVITFILSGVVAYCLCKIEKKK